MLFYVLSDGTNRYYPDQNIKALPKDIFFVFGSNLAGRHGKGAALTALLKFGALYGNGEGLQGRSYAIPTKDKYIRSLPLEHVKTAIERFVSFTHNSSRCFCVTAVGTGLAGFKTEEIAPLFKGARNCWFPESFKPFIED